MKFPHPFGKWVAHNIPSKETNIRETRHRNMSGQRKDSYKHINIPDNKAPRYIKTTELRDSINSQ